MSLWVRHGEPRVRRARATGSKSLWCVLAPTQELTGNQSAMAKTWFSPSPATARQSSQAPGQTAKPGRQRGSGLDTSLTTGSSRRSGASQAAAEVMGTPAVILTSRATAGSFRASRQRWSAPTAPASRAGFRAEVPVGGSHWKQHGKHRLADVDDRCVRALGHARRSWRVRTVPATHVPPTSGRPVAAAFEMQQAAEFDWG